MSNQLSLHENQYLACCALGSFALCYCRHLKKCCTFLWKCHKPELQRKMNLAESKGNAISYLFSGAIGALPCLQCPVDTLEGQNNISSACRVKHGVPLRDADVQELSRTARFLCPQDV